jgi:hypothetical protein
MYLAHITELKYIKNILEDGELKSNKLTNNIESGEGIYNTHNNFVYFITTEKLFDKKILGSVILYLNSDLIYNRTFYVSTTWSNTPDHISEWYSNKRFQYKRKYSRYYDKYNQILSKLYNYSINVLPNSNSFQVFQQVAIKNKVNITDKLIGIQFQSKPSNKLIQYIHTNYPDVKIIF